MDAGTQHSRLKLVDRPKRQAIKGDRLTGPEIQEVRWKSGTVLFDEDDRDYLLLDSTGRWASSDAYAETYSFAEMEGSGPFTVIHLPDSVNV